MVKEEKERKPKQDIDKEFPKWAWIDYTFYTMSPNPLT
jgi:hypothetical protein